MPPGRAGAVVEQIRAGFDSAGDGQEDQLRHQLGSVARRPVLTGFIVVLFVEAPHELLEQRAHGNV
jgi:hypothetical protein